MITRRRFIGSVAMLSAALIPEMNWAGSDPASRVALVVGNSHYPNMELRNPGNDARAMTDLFGKAGFHVDTGFDLNRESFLAAIQQFGRAISNSDVQLAAFYYAGHGAQLNWHNYLIPVDAHVSTGDELKARCVDLGSLLSALGGAKGKTYIVILDACRNNPFSGTYQPKEAGLSQFDAPVGSLLAYATSPGSVALDGDANNGLYTDNLIRELSRTGTKIEDAFKRVRLNVRLMSNGAQVPWESTSLESDVYILGSDAKPVSDAEIEETTREDLDTWLRIKSSHNLDDWVAYLRKFPNGRFAEIAQVRLMRLLAVSNVHASLNPLPSKPVATSEPSAPRPSLTVTSVPLAAKSVGSITSDSANQVASASISDKPPVSDTSDSTIIEVASGDTLTNLNRPSANPFSAGRYPLGRHFTVNDEAVFLVSDLLTGLPKKRYRVRITMVDLDVDRVEGNDGLWVWDSMGNTIVSPGTGVHDVPAQIAPAEIQIGKKWSAAWHADHPTYGKQFISLDLKIVAREKVTAAQQTFNAFRIEGSGWIDTYQGLGVRSVMADRKYWIVPGINFPIKVELINRRQARATRLERTELVMLRQQAIDVSEDA